MSGAHPRSRWSYFRLSADWADTIVDDAQVARGDTVLDLGAGTGALTAPLLARGARVIALEKHPGRAESLRARFEDRPLVVVEADIRDLQLPSVPGRREPAVPPGTPPRGSADAGEAAGRRGHPASP